MDWATPATWDPSIITSAKGAPRKVGNPGTKTEKRVILNVLAAFDIETSHTPNREDAHLYHWQMQIGLETLTIHGRTWDDLRMMFSRLQANIGEKQTLVIYVHNLSFEWQHLRTIYPFTNDDIFCPGPRKILRAYMYDHKIELRCSYLLTNMGLSTWTKEMKVAHPKLDSDDYDHERIRYPWDELSEEEQEYCRNDVLGLCEALRAQLDRDHDTLATIPATSTGYVRRDVKQAMKRWSRWAIINMQPDRDVFRALVEEFRGGDTHTNRYYAAEVLEKVGSVDRSSSYPDVLVNCRFPMSPWRRWLRLAVTEIERLKKLDMALLFRIRFFNLRLCSVSIGDPPLSLSKARNVGGHTLDNGRIMYASVCETTLTDIDWLVYQDCYTWDEAEILDGWYSSYDYLPDPIRQLLIQYYKRKTELKGVKGPMPDTGVDAEMLFALSKALLNSIYGLMAQNPCKPDTIFNGTNFDAPDETEDERIAKLEADIDEKLAKNRIKAFTSYAWGCWTTSWARFRLHEICTRVAGRNAVYWDTDSCKYLGGIDLTAYNQQRIADSTASGAWADDPKGVRHYMGVFEYEGTYDRFISNGSKSYVYEDADGLHVTISGVNKKIGPKELEAAGGIDAYKPGFIFRAAGGTESKYNDLTREVIEIEGHKLELGPNIYISPSTYKIGRIPEHGEVLHDPIFDDEELIAEDFEDFEFDNL